MLVYRDYVLVFVITAMFDLALNLLPPPIGAVLLRDYFSSHTVLAAALLAGFIGAFTFPVISLFTSVEKPTWHAIMVVFLVSAFIGFPMEWTGFFPKLNEHYYDKLPRYQSFLADGLSGMMVACVYWLVLGRVNRSTMLKLIIMWSSIFVLYLGSVKMGLIVRENINNAC